MIGWVFFYYMMIFEYSGPFHFGRRFCFGFFNAGVMAHGLQSLLVCLLMFLPVGKSTFALFERVNLEV